MPHGRHRAGRGRRPLVALGAVAGLALLAAGGWVVWRSTVTPEPSLAAVAPPEQRLVPDTGDTTPQVPVFEEQSPPAFGSDEGVLLIGDSLAVGIADPLTTSLDGRAVAVEAEEGRSTDTSVALVADHAATTPGVWVVSLGTNDNPEEFLEDAQSLLELAGPDRCVLWFDIHRDDTETEINATLRQLEREHANLQLVSWQDLADAHPEWFTIDDIHPDTTGYEQRALLATAAVEQACTSP